MQELLHRAGLVFGPEDEECPGERGFAERPERSFPLADHDRLVQQRVGSLGAARDVMGVCGHDVEEGRDAARPCRFCECDALIDVPGAGVRFALTGPRPPENDPRHGFLVVEAAPLRRGERVLCRRASKRRVACKVPGSGEGRERTRPAQGVIDRVEALTDRAHRSQRLARRPANDLHDGSGGMEDRWQILVVDGGRRRELDRVEDLACAGEPLFRFERRARQRFRRTDQVVGQHEELADAERLGDAEDRMGVLGPLDQRSPHSVVLDQPDQGRQLLRPLRDRGAERLDPREDLQHLLRLVPAERRQRPAVREPDRDLLLVPRLALG